MIALVYPNRVVKRIFGFETGEDPDNKWTKWKTRQKVLRANEYQEGSYRLVNRTYHSVCSEVIYSVIGTCR